MIEILMSEEFKKHGYLFTQTINSILKNEDVVTEIHLSRELSERRIFPAIDVKKSGTRKDELLLSEEELSSAYKLRRMLTEKCETTVALLDMIKKTKNNAELVVKTDAWLKIYNN